MGDADRIAEGVIANCDFYIAELNKYDWLGRENAEGVLVALAAAGFAVVPQADVDATARLRARIEQLHAPEDQEAEVWWGDADHDQRFPDCPSEDDCEGHVCTITVCSQCGYAHDGEAPIFRQWPCPTVRAAAVGSGTPAPQVLFAPEIDDQ